MYQFRDPIHGFIEVSDLELKIIDTPAFQRLRNIRQLSTTYLVYPGAEHSRFGHSLGVMHLVTKAFESALENYKRTNGVDLFDVPTQAWYKQILRLIALVHDLGHAPFSHGSEKLFVEGKEHEDYTYSIITDKLISKHIKKIGKKFQEEHGNAYTIDPDLLWLIYGDKNPEFKERYIMPDFMFLKSFMDSDIDCDKMDYLLRDSYYCGVNYGSFDLNRLLASLNIYVCEKENIMQLALERGGIHAFEEFVIARYFMFIQVYFHKTRRYLDKLLVDCIADILQGGKYPKNTDEYLMYDDNYILQKIRENSKKNGDIADRAKKFINREVMTCVYETKPHEKDSSDVKLYRSIRNKLQSLQGCDIFEDNPRKLSHMIPTLSGYDEENGKGIPILDRYSRDPVSVIEESILLKSLHEKIDIRRIYIDKQHAEKAKRIINNY